MKSIPCECGAKKDRRAQRCHSCANRIKAREQWRKPEIRAKMIAGLEVADRVRRSWDDLTEADFYPRKQDGRYKAYYWRGGRIVSVYRNVWRWTKVHGAIPRGMHVHHRNEHRTDDRIENLQLLTHSDHISLHMDDDHKRRMVEARGQEYIGASEYQCVQCSGKFVRCNPKRANRFCGHACRIAWMKQNSKV